MDSKLQVTLTAEQSIILQAALTAYKNVVDEKYFKNELHIVDEILENVKIAQEDAIRNKLKQEINELLSTIH